MSIIESLKARNFVKEAEILQKEECSSVRITTAAAKEEDFALGESKIGGKPHLPDDFKWPYYLDEPLIFIAQFNLGEIAKYDVENKLPSSGMLYFFYEGGIEVFGDDLSEKDGIKVAYYEGSIDKLKAINLPERSDASEYDELIIKPCKLSFVAEPSYPLTQMLENDILDYDILDDDDEANEETTNKLLGYPDLIQGDVFDTAATIHMRRSGNTKFSSTKEYRAAFQSELKKWMLLFQIDSDDQADVMWGDVGRVYFVIRDEDLERGDFENCWFEFQCY